MNNEQRVESLTHYLRASAEDLGQWEKFLSAIHTNVAHELTDVVSALLSDTADDRERNFADQAPAPPKLQPYRPVDLAPYHAIDEAPPLFGSIWTTKLADTFKTSGLRMVPPTVVILSPPPEADTHIDLAQVAPISDWTLFAAADDLLLPESTGHGHIMVQLWNEQPIQRSQLHKVIGVLNPEELQWLTALWSARRGGEAATSVPAHALGPPLQGATDIRTLFREFECLRGQLLSYPARQAFVSEHESAEPERGDNLLLLHLPDSDTSFAPAEEELADAAASGQRFTPCVIHPETPGALLKESPAHSHLAHCISFDTLTPDQPDTICCEWTFPVPYGAKTPENMLAHIFDKNTNQRVGTATAHLRGTEYLILLNQHQLPPGAAPIRDPQQLRILLMEKAPS